jgi:hypothetical protein
MAFSNSPLDGELAKVVTPRLARARFRSRIGPETDIASPTVSTRWGICVRGRREDSLVLVRAGDGALDGEVVEESNGLVLTLLVAMPLAVKEEISLGPVELCLLGPDAVA